MTARATINRRPFTMRVRDVLREAGLSCEVSRPPLPPPGQRTPSLPYVVLDPIGGTFIGPEWDAPESFAELSYQATSVGKSAHQCEALADRVRHLLVGFDGDGYASDLNTEGLVVTGRWSESPETIDHEPPLMALPERFRFAVHATA